jgi:class 3 adenylate cyclase
MIDREKAARKFDSLASLYGRTLDRDAMDACRKWILEADDEALEHAQPFLIARDSGAKPRKVLDVMVCAAKAGLFDMRWTLVCPYCGFVDKAFDSINGLKEGSFHCYVCDVDHSIALDDQVEVLFEASPSIRKRDEISEATMYARYHRSPSAALRPGTTKHTQDSLAVDLAALDPDDAAHFEFVPMGGQFNEFVSFELGASLLGPSVPPKGEGPMVFDVDAAERAFDPGRAEFEIGRPTGVRIRNRSGKSARVMRYYLPLALLSQKPTPRPFHKRVLGATLLNNARYRELFGGQVVSRELNVAIRSLTLLFTDLKSSTELYSELGDIRAYELVKEHFSLLTEVVDANGGAVVKTIGDAVMASFDTPRDGLAAAMAMNGAIADLHEKFALARKVGIKIGLHAGPAVAVSQNERLDYFGQAVNIAARVQNLADTGEIWITDAIAGDPDAADEIAARFGAIPLERIEAKLKGIAEAQAVYRLPFAS